MDELQKLKAKIEELEKAIRELNHILEIRDNEINQLKKELKKHTS